MQSAGQILRELRGSQSRREVAKKCNISVSALQMYENDQRRPRDEVKLRLAACFGVPVAHIFFNNELHEMCS